jgi:ubiquinone/menaquinone biosynthesis C-methylase UbiE
MSETDAGELPATPILPYIPLPELEDPRTAGRVFDSIATVYDKVRPGYPSAALEDLRTRCGIGPGRRVLEVGCGTGQLTRSLAVTGATVRSLEPGPSLLALARENLGPTANVEFALSTFEDADEVAESYDLVVSATAFHWVDPHVGYPKAARVLKPGGWLGLLSNMHVVGGTDDQIADAVQELQGHHAPEIGRWTFPSVDELEARAREGGDIAATWCRVERKVAEPPEVSRLFGPPTVTTYPWTATYDRDGYVAMLSTQSTYVMMESARRDALLSDIGIAIDATLGGTITKQYLTVMAISPRQRVTAGAT